MKVGREACQMRYKRRTKSIYSSYIHKGLGNTLHNQF